MLKKLRNINSTTPISQLPDILNYNNDVMTEELEYIYDSSNGRLVKSVYVPQGKIQAYTGEFRTLTVDNIQINNPTTLVNNVVKRAADIPHNAFGYNFSSSAIENVYEVVNKERNEIICHDASTIAFPAQGNDINSFKYLGFGLGNATQDDTITLYNVTIKEINKLQDLENRVSTLETLVDELSIVSGGGGVAIPDNAENYKNKPTEVEVTYPKTYMYATIVQLKRQHVPALHINDLKGDSHLLTYYPVSNAVKVNNKTFIAIECWQVGRIVDIQFDPASNTPFTFLLKRNQDGTRNYLQVTYAKMNCLQLRCSGYTDEYGTEWTLYNWSGNEGNFNYITL